MTLEILKNRDELEHAREAFRKAMKQGAGNCPKALLSYALPVMMAFRQEFREPLKDTDFDADMEALIDNLRCDLEGQYDARMNEHPPYEKEPV